MSGSPPSPPGDTGSIRFRLQDLAGQMFVSLVENSPDLICIAMLDGEIYYMNPAGADLLGVDDSPMPSRVRVQDFAGDKGKVILGDVIASLIRTGRWKGEMRARHLRTGVQIPIETHAFLIRDPKTGEPIAMAGISRDLAERKRVENALRLSEEKFSKAFRISPDAVNLSRRSDGRILEINESFCRLLGYDPEEVIGETSLKMNIWVDPADRAELLRRLADEGEVRNLEAKFRRKDGSIGTGLLSSREVEVDGERCILAITRDISERTRLEEELRQAQKMEAVGRLAGGVAHDFNNLLTAIIGYSEVLLSGMRPGDPANAELLAIRNAGQSAAALTRQLLAFSRKQVLDLRPTALNGLVSQMEDMLRRVIGDNIVLKTRLERELWTVRADGNQFQQVLMNLAINARDAMPEGGTLAIETRNVLVDAAAPAKPPDCPAGRYAVLSVRDTGHGMDEETAREIFEPFFTTKEAGKGTGLGLSMVHGIVRQSGGFIEVATAPGRGADFHVYLPRVEDPAEPEPGRPPAESGDARGGTETLLLVEDSDVVRAYTAEILRMGGYAVLEAASGEEALRIAENLGRPVDLLVTDMMMPGIGGRELAATLAASRPGLKVLFMSGYPDPDVEGRGTKEAGAFFLGKPFQPGGLLRKVREILDK